MGEKTRAARVAFPDADITCVESDQGAVRHLESLKFRVISREWPEAAAMLPGKVDSILLCHTLEHVANPRIFLDTLVNALEPGGILVVEVPNDPSWRVYASIHSPHILFFTPDSLRELLEQFGEVLFVDTASHITRRKRPHWQDVLVSAIPKPVRAMRAKLRNEVAGKQRTLTDEVKAQDEYGGAERFAVRAVLRRRNYCDQLSRGLGD